MSAIQWSFVRRDEDVIMEDAPEASPPSSPVFPPAPSFTFAADFFGAGEPTQAAPTPANRNRRIVTAPRQANQPPLESIYSKHVQPNLHHQPPTNTVQPQNETSNDMAFEIIWDHEEKSDVPAIYQETEGYTITATTAPLIPCPAHMIDE